MLVAAWISDTTSGDGDSVVISHAAPTFCIHEPTLEARAAIQSARKSRSRSGFHTEPSPRAGGCLSGRAPPYAGKVARFYCRKSQLTSTMLSIRHEPTWDEPSLSESGSEFRRCNDILLSIDIRQLWEGGW